MPLVYLNNAATSWPKAPGVAEAVAEALARPLVGPGRGSDPAACPVERCRVGLAALLAVPDPRRIVLTHSATAALNLAIHGLALEPGDRVVTGAAEHNSVLRPLEHLRRGRGVEVEVVALTPQGELDEDAFARALLPPPRLVVLTHASNVTGRVYPVERLFRLAKAAGAATLLDASQSLGHLDIRPAELGADLVAFPGHKALLGPAGTGGLYVGPSLDLEQVLVGGTGVRSDLPLHPPEMPMRLEAGTPNLPGLAGLAAALEWRSAAAPPSPRSLTGALREALDGIPGLRLYDSGPAGPATGIVSLSIPGWDPAAAGEALELSFGITCRTGLHCAPRIHPFLGSAPHGTVRFSLSCFTVPEEIHAAAAAVRRLAGCV